MTKVFPRKELRRELRQRRGALSGDARKRATQSALRRLSRLAWLRKAKHIALYYPVGAELDTKRLFNNRWMRNKKFYLPVLATAHERSMLFAQWQQNTVWRRNRHHIPEPLQSTLRRPTQLDVVIAPLVGFDDRCNRLGAGGGHYDRSFDYRRTRASWRRPRLVGLAFECQRLERLEAQDWDVPLDAVVTEQRVYWR